jgi:glycosyltransferase involved in cell wall biosynthesis
LSIAIYTELFVPHIGGQEYRYLELSRHLAALGHRVDIFTLMHDKRLPKEELAGNVRIHRDLYLRRYDLHGSRDPVGVLAYSANCLRDVLTHAQFDVRIFNQWPLVNVIAAEPFARSVTLVDWVEIWRKEPVRTLQFLVSNLPDGHACVSEEIRLAVIKRFHVSPQRTEVIPSGVDTSQYAADAKAKEWGSVIYVGRLMRHKHVDLMIRAFEIAQTKKRGLTLDIVGDGPELSRLKQLARENSNIRFHGRLPEDEKISMLKKSWLLALPSEREGFPRVLAEAWAAGTPTLVCNFPGNSAVSLVDRRRVGIISHPSPRAIAQELLDLDKDEMRWRNLAQNTQPVATSLDWRNVARRFESFLHRLLDMRSSGRRRQSP